LPVQDCPPAIMPGVPVIPGVPGTAPQPVPSLQAPGAPAAPSAPGAKAPAAPAPAPGATPPGQSPMQTMDAPADFGGVDTGAASPFNEAMNGGGATGASSAFAQAPPSGTADAASSAPHMIGDSQSQSIVRPFLLNLILFNDAGLLGTINQQIRFQQPIVARGSYQIGENESPRPTDRLHLTYHYCNNLRFRTEPATSALSLTPNSVQFNRFGPGPTPLPIGFDITEFSKIELHRYTFGFEKTFLDGNASLGIRIPILQTVQAINSTVNTRLIQAFSNPGLTTVGAITSADNNIDHTDIGDITLIFKYVLCCNRLNGNLISAGVAVTIPTGPNIRNAADNEIHPVLIQPYLGYLFTLCPNVSLQGFTAIVAPTDSRDNVRIFNDIGVGY